MKSGRYLKVAFALFVGVYWIGLPSFVLCGEKVSGKIVQLSDKDRETLAVTRSYVGAYEVSVPAGRYETVLLKSTFVGEVGPASVNDFGYVFFSKGYGVVASVEHMHVGAFLFYNKTTKTPKILLQKKP